MKYMLLIYGAEDAWTEGEREGCYAESIALTHDLKGRGQYLGASPLQVLLTVTLPMMTPGLFAGWLFAAILSFNEFTASLFVTSQSTQTLPVAMYIYVREFADPTMAALAVMFFVLTAGLLILTNVCLGLGKVLAIEERR